MTIKIKTPVETDITVDNINDIDSSKGTAGTDSGVDNNNVNTDASVNDEPGKPITVPNVDNDNGNSSDDTVVSIDDKDYSIDKDGNALNEDGSVFMSKDELDALSNSDNDTDKGANDNLDVTIEDLEKLSGVILKDKDGNKLSFDMSLEGLAKREKHVKDHGFNEGVNTALKEFFNNNVDLYKAYIHKQKTGSLEGFSAKSIYSDVSLQGASEEQLMNLVIDAETRAGKNPDEAKRYAKFLKVENALEDAANKSLEFLKSQENKEFEAYEQTKQDEVKKQIEFDKKYYGTYYDETGKEVIVDTPDSIYNKIVTKGQFGNYVIPEDGITVKSKDKEIKLSRKDIFNYISTPVTNDGKSKADLDLDNLFANVDFRLRFYMMNLTGNDLSVFLNREVLKQKSSTIKRKLSTGVPSNTNVVNDNNASKKVLKLPVK
jgi:hypothetical protein